MRPSSPGPGREADQRRGGERAVSATPARSNPAASLPAAPYPWLLAGRWDTTAYALIAAWSAAVLSFIVLNAGCGWTAALAAPAAIAAAGLAGSVPVWLRRRMAPDVTIVPLPGVGAEQLLRAASARHCLMLMVVFKRHPFAGGRLDVLVNGVQAGQLRHGDGMVLSLRRGRHELAFRFSVPGNTLREVISSVPRTRAGFVLDTWGSRFPRLAISPIPRGGEAAAAAGCTFVRPVVPLI